MCIRDSVMKIVRRTVYLVLTTLLATTLSLVAATSPAQAQEAQPDCSDGVGTATRQWRDNTINAIIGEISDWIQDHPWSPESLGDYYDRCGPPDPPPPPPGYSQSLPGGPGASSGRRGSSAGDPHIVTQDGVRYDFHASGDFTLVETLDGSTTMHIRYAGTGPISLFDGVAFSVDGVRFSMSTFRHGELAEFYIDDELIELRANGIYCLLYTSPSPRDATLSRMPSSA